ncbi:acyl-CoA dehydrogenase [Amphiplicatus metriothermophilus]|uniref:3-methylmercaptopropionyl-CoA dehydrogenase n=1 Tax=Amphiplicatus metriothermophilus TaxID=1519374 RepID=A0A239PIC0_9PROT|nr:acyl-CoA dehydrogenase [Amphiplicatus metriothermophilus]MBB5518104.1 alkylation response protein AidB-like acyl-CoA dehydrogenase [Amphiplicatus metriothermophilus]SNT67562.1 Acyl-CoA dehydrogenase [Amphiplicatus metriothermophilus]
MSFATPVRDMRFSLEHMAGFGALEKTGAFADLSDDLVAAILGEMAKYCDNVVAPLNEPSDRDPARLENGVVRTPKGFREAYRQYVEGGWNALAFPEEWGGQGLPQTLAIALVDALNQACMSFAIGTTLTTGAVKALLHAGTDEQKRLYLPKMVSGEWTGTMNLTEPQAGSDLSALRTKAEPAGDGRYKIAGQKIFITYGEHDMTDNIVHLVLARLPDAPEGTAGISMFLVPKIHVNEDGSLGARNDVQCLKLEEKMGLHGSPTCVMAYGEKGECYGTLLGEEHRGLKNMFVMMNAARLDVGVQGVGVAERAFQRALAYALERRQGRPPGVKAGEMIPIYEHADVRRMLYSMKSLVEASRAICYANAVAYDLARRAPDEKKRKEAKALEDLLTPISKGWSTDRANEVASLGVQIHGGMGYIEETGAAQHMRDVRIAAIYEGTNGIQAMDLVGRKLQMDGGTAAKAFIRKVKEEAVIARAGKRPELKRIGARLEEAANALEASTDWLLEASKKDQHDALAAATPYLKQFGNVAGGYYLARGAMAAALMLGEEGADKAYLEGRIAVARFFAENYLTEAAGLTQAIAAGAESVARLDPEALTG